MEERRREGWGVGDGGWGIGDGWKRGWGGACVSVGGSSVHILFSRRKGFGSSKQLYSEYY